MSTYFPKEGEIARKWFVVDATDRTLGRLASQVARILMGKENPQYTTFLDTGDHVIVINAAKVRVTGSKESDKKYYRQPRAGFPGALKTTNLATLRARHPEDVVLNAVRRMLPRNALGRQMMTKLKVYPDDKHPHAAQQPVPREVKA